MLVMAILSSGRKVVSEFTKVENLRKYAAEVFKGTRPFNVWHKNGTDHPSGEEILQRSRELINGDKIESIQEVTRVGGEAGDYAPEHFAPVFNIKRGPAGIWTCPTDPAQVPEGAVPGVKYPVKISALSGRRYVTIQKGVEGETDAESVPEKRFFTDGRGREAAEPVYVGYRTPDPNVDDRTSDEDDE